MTSDEIAIKIFNSRPFHAGTGAEMIQEYARNLAVAAYEQGYEDGRRGIQPNPSIGLSEMDPDNYN